MLYGGGAELENADRPRPRTWRLYADRGYDFDTYRRSLRKRGIKPLIARRGVAHGSGRGRSRRHGARPATA